MLTHPSRHSSFPPDHWGALLGFVALTEDGALPPVGQAPAEEGAAASAKEEEEENDDEEGEDGSDEDRAAFHAFKAAHKLKGYGSRAEEAAHFRVFRANVARMRESSNGAASTGGATHVSGVGPFADLTDAEIAARYTMGGDAHRARPAPPEAQGLHAHDPTYLGEHRAPPPLPPSLPPSPSPWPAKLDWVAEGVVTAVKKQRCGDCWTFSATGSLEGAWGVAHTTGNLHQLTNFSEQEFVDCVDDGCDGGWSFNALKFAVNHTVCTAKDFPCTAAGNGTQCALWRASNCSSAKGALAQGAVAGWKSVGGAKWGATTEDDLLDALQQGPISINIFADTPMGHYAGGVLSYSNCSKGTNHGVLAVGYGTCEGGGSESSSGPCANVTTKLDYWKVKNRYGRRLLRYAPRPAPGRPARAELLPGIALLI